jgi:hypothetical protein
MPSKPDLRCFVCGERCDQTPSTPSLWSVHLGIDRDAHISCVNRAFYHLEAVGKTLAAHGKVADSVDFAMAINDLVKTKD